jgi:hypothetical protein
MDVIEMGTWRRVCDGTLYMPSQLDSGCYISIGRHCEERSKFNSDKKTTRSSHAHYGVVEVLHISEYTLSVTQRYTIPPEINTQHCLPPCIDVNQRSRPHLSPPICKRYLNLCRPSSPSISPGKSKAPHHISPSCMQKVISHYVSKPVHHSPLYVE